MNRIYLFVFYLVFFEYLSVDDQYSKLRILSECCFYTKNTSICLSQVSVSSVICADMLGGLVQVLILSFLLALSSRLIIPLCSAWFWSDVLFEFSYSPVQLVLHGLKRIGETHYVDVGNRRALKSWSLLGVLELRQLVERGFWGALEKLSVRPTRPKSAIQPIEAINSFRENPGFFYFKDDSSDISSLFGKPWYREYDSCF